MSDNAHADGAHDAEADPGELSVAARDRARGLVQPFGKTRAADGVDPVVPAGIVFGPLGRNVGRQGNDDQHARSDQRSAANLRCWDRLLNMSGDPTFEVSVLLRPRYRAQQVPM